MSSQIRSESNGLCNSDGALVIMPRWRGRGRWKAKWLSWKAVLDPSPDWQRHLGLELRIFLKKKPTKNMSVYLILELEKAREDVT